MPKVSVVMGTYNDDKFISDAVNSILVQSFKDLEFIIINDGSIDMTADILRKFSDNRMRVVDRANMGISAARRKAIEISEGEYIAIQDGDDISFHERLEKQIKFLDINKNIGLVGTAVLGIDEKNGELISKHFPENNDVIQKRILSENCFCSPSIMFRRDIYKRIGGYRDEFKVAEDYDLLLRFAETCEVHNLKEVLYKRRLNRNSLSVTMFNQMNSYTLLAQILAKERRSGKNEKFEENMNKIIKQEHTYISELLNRFKRIIFLYRQEYAVGCICLYNGNSKKARSFYLRSLKYNLFNVKTYICLFLTLLPLKLIKNMKFVFRETIRYSNDESETR